MPRWFGRQVSARVLVRILVPLGLVTIVLSVPLLVQNPSLSFYKYVHWGKTAKENRLPPLYPELKAAELALPQHDEDLPFPEGKHAKFVRFGNQMWGVGLNNQLFEILLNTEIARRSGRAYVFTPFIWDPFVGEDAYVPITKGSNHLAASAQTVRAAKIPLRAFFHSPTSGEPWPVRSDPRTPRAVSDKWYDRMCPEEKRVQIDPSVVSKEIGVDLDRDDGTAIVDKWAKYLRELDTPCANIKWATPRIIDFGLMGNERLLPLWPSFSTSPVLTSFRWSPIVMGAVARNFARLGIISSQDQLPAGSALDSTQESFIPGLLTVHIRRKDYETHCSWMSGWAIFHSWNLLPFLPDRFVPPAGSSSESAADPPTESREQYMVRRCWVEIQDVVKKVNAVRRDFLAEEGKGVGLNRIYISTNEGRQWVDRLEDALRRDDGGYGWKEITGSPDTELTWGESGVENAIDMEMAARGEVFIGNGFSTFSSTIVSLRLSRGLPAKNIRFW